MIEFPKFASNKHCDWVPSKKKTIKKFTTLHIQKMSLTFIGQHYPFNMNEAN